MTIDTELEGQILRYHHVEHWGVNTIASQLGVHHSVVDRVLSQAGMPKIERAARPSIIDPYVPFILDTLARFPTLTATRLFHMVRARGYSGAESHFRSRVAGLRPRPTPEAYLRLKTLPGEQGQVDWGHFGHLEIGRARRPLMAFVIVLSWSRAVFLRFSLDARAASFAAGHVQAFERFGGVPRVLLYDNLKSAVLERRGQAIRFNPALLELAAAYRFEPRPVALARGNEKGRVERAIRYIRTSFFAGRAFTDLDDLNAQADAWCATVAAERPCPEAPELAVGEAFAREREHLIALPANAPPVAERVEVRVPKTPYVRFDLNDYSVPHALVRRTLTVLADAREVRVLDGSEEVARHPRSWSRAEQIECERHVAELVAIKREAREHRGLGRLAAAVPATATLLERAAARGTPLKAIGRELERLLEEYGAKELAEAVDEALERGVPHSNAVRQALVRRREARDLPPLVPLRLPPEVRARDAVVAGGTLADYDRLHRTDEADEADDATANDPSDTDKETPR